MAIVATRKNTRIVFADDAKKQLQGYSGINPGVTADGARVFADAFESLQTATLGYITLEKTDKLEDIV